MNRYIEVTGEGSYVENAARFVAEITVEVRAAKQETAMDEAAALWKSAPQPYEVLELLKRKSSKAAQGIFTRGIGKRKSAKRLLVRSFSRFPNSAA